MLITGLVTALVSYTVLVWKLSRGRCTVSEVMITRGVCRGGQRGTGRGGAGRGGAGREAHAWLQP
jgi:hypothetical protein